jgi:hypothetical protein
MSLKGLSVEQLLERGELMTADRLKSLNKPVS